jgi:ubiquinone biosynthesis protein
VHVKSATLDRVNASLRAAAVITFLGLCACGFIVGAFISFAQVAWTVRGYPVLGLLGTAGAAALFGAAFTWYLFGNRFGKISLRRLLPGKDRAAR